MIDHLVFEGDPRGLFEYRNILRKDPYPDAAKALHAASTVFILTGFYIPETACAETDGPLGAAALGSALARLGKKVFYISDDHGTRLLDALHCPNIIPFPITDPDSSRRYADELLIACQPDVVISVERPGPNRTGRFLTMRDIDITEQTAHLEPFMTGCCSIGIGDGGNELGLGALLEFLPEKRSITTVKSDHMLLGTTSNWAAYGLVVALEILNIRTDLLPDPAYESKQLQRLVDGGAVDGVTRERTCTVDGFSMTQNEVVLVRLRQYSRSIQHGRHILERFSSEEHNHYPLPVIAIRPVFDPVTSALHFSGSLLAVRQLERLQELCRETEIPVGFDIRLLSDPDQVIDGMEWGIPDQYPQDILNYPGGTLATQLMPEDGPVRVLHEHDPWILIQAPDLSMGWAESRYFQRMIPTPEAQRRLWRTIQRAQSGFMVPCSHDPAAISDIARTYLGIPYRLGGRSRSGMDCSALVQSIISSLGILLPRHSKDQRRMGTGVSRHTLQSGDLLFAYGKKRRIHHVALALTTGIIHSCLARKQVSVVTEPEFESEYQIVAVRRIMQWKGGIG